MKIFSYFLGGSRKIPELKELFKTESSNELNVDTILNKYGIKTEFAGNLHLNLNVVIQNKELMEKIAKTQAELLQTAIDKWREEELAKINENPSAYIKTTNS